ncbi:HD domain-containing protein [Conexibacter sp. W3-3-2]|uniref:HD-GYP domain-containing protein n=1 Tax=Conexibacter sp. W3-3-2 TaxID=2675227 RepID=UPI0012B84C0F|nr:HD domain-containing phosphohydrolase [Conexibacter sp. W3-3-2]MTD47266.1 HD domain-containing protein [Conexibacter sp. W3-3-2]
MLTVPNLRLAWASCAGAGGLGLGLTLLQDSEISDPWTILALALFFAVADLSAVEYRPGIWISTFAAFWVIGLVYLGPLEALTVFAIGVTVSATGARALRLPGVYSVLGYVWALCQASVVSGAFGLALAQLDYSRSEPEALAAVAAVTMAGAAVAFAVLHAAHYWVRAGTGPRSVLREFRETWLLQILESISAGAIAFFYAVSPSAGTVAALALLLVYVRVSVAARDARLLSDRYNQLAWGVLSTMGETLALRDARAARHGAAVGRLARAIAVELELDPRQQELAETAGLLHDIGIFAMSDAVLDIEGGLTPDGWRQVREHPSVGARLLAPLDAYGPIAEIVACHHERPDGLGYPRGLSGEQIPLLSKVIAVAEAYDAMTAHSYQPPIGTLRALAELRKKAGRQFDPVVVEALARALAGTPEDFRVARNVDFGAAIARRHKMGLGTSRPSF